MFLSCSEAALADGLAGVEIAVAEAPVRASALPSGSRAARATGSGVR